MRRCIYCNIFKDESEFSLEHIFPSALGGKLCDDMFKTRHVCKNCNNKCGLYVDGLFIKSWFVKNESSAMLEYIDLNSNRSIFPLNYIGQMALPGLDEDHVCELWLGLKGARYYHIHERDGSEWASYAGGNPRSRKADAGRVYLVNTSSDMRAVGLNIRTMKHSFKNARRYATNITILNDLDKSPFIHALDSVAQEEISKILALKDDVHPGEFTIMDGFEQRFLAKVARGLGFKILGESYLDTEYSYHLLAALNEKSIESRKAFLVRGSGFFQHQDDGLNQIIGWKGAYTIHLHISGDYFGLSLYLPSTKSMHIVISDEARLWASTALNNYCDGFIYIIMPQLGKFVGPIEMPEYIAHRQGLHNIQELSAIETMRVDPDSFISTI